MVPEEDRLMCQGRDLDFPVLSVPETILIICTHCHSLPEGGLTSTVALTLKFIQCWLSEDTGFLRKMKRRVQISLRQIIRFCQVFKERGKEKRNKNKNKTQEKGRTIKNRRGQEEGKKKYRFVHLCFFAFRNTTHVCLATSLVTFVGAY